MSGDISIGLLKESINNLSKTLNQQIVSNNLYTISNLLCSGYITLDEALNNSDFKAFYDNLHKNDLDKKILIKANNQKRI